MTLRFVPLVALLALAGCEETDAGEPAASADIVWDVDSDGRMDLLAQDGLWGVDPADLTFAEVGNYSAYYSLSNESWRSRGPRVGGASAVLLAADTDGCATDLTSGGVRALAADGTSECVLGELFDASSLGQLLVVQQADGPECLIHTKVEAPEVGCSTSTLDWQGWFPITTPTQLEGQKWWACGGVFRPAGEVGMLICTNRLIGWASAAVDGGELQYVEFSTPVDLGVRHAEDSRFPNHFGIGSGNSVDGPPEAPTRLCLVSDWDAGELSCEVIDDNDAISSIQLMKLESDQSAPAVFVRSEYGDQQWVYLDGERREVTVSWPDWAESPWMGRHVSEAVTVIDADGDGVDELAVRSWRFEDVAPVLLEFDGDAAFVPAAPP